MLCAQSALLCNTSRVLFLYISNPYRVNAGASHDLSDFLHPVVSEAFSFGLQAAHWTKFVSVMMINTAETLPAKDLSINTMATCCQLNSCLKDLHYSAASALLSKDIVNILVTRNR